MRVWDMGGSSTKDLDYSERNGDGSPNGGEQNQEVQNDPVCAHPSLLQLQEVSSYRDICIRHINMVRINDVMP